MRKKINAILITVILAVVLLATLVSCSRSSTVDFFGYTEKDMNLIGRFVKVMHEWIGSYGWTVVVFTVILKVVMLPLDFWQRYSSRKSTLKMQRIQPLLEGIDKRYGANTQRANEEKQKLYKKQGYSMLGTCLPMILSMVIFFIVFGGLNAYSKYCNIEAFRSLSNKYYDVSQELFEKDENLSVVFKEEFEAREQKRLQEFLDEDANKGITTTDETELKSRAEIARINAQINAIKRVTEIDSVKAKEVHEKAIVEVQKLYNEEKESWLWIKNVWQPDTWSTVMPEYGKGNNKNNTFTGMINMGRYPDNEATYNIIRKAILDIDGVSYGKNGTWNGLMILPFMSIGLSFLSMWVSQRMERKNRKGEAPAPTAQNQQQQATNRMMMILMPAMMAVFGFMYTGAFAIYMVCNYMLSLLTTVALRWPVEKAIEKNLAKEEKKQNSSKASYMR